MDPIENAKMKGILLNSPTMKCECGNALFTPALIFKKVSALMNPAGTEQNVPIDVMVCTKCGKVLNTFSDEDTYKKILGITNEKTIQL